MKYSENSCSDINICYIGGGSQGWAWKLMSDLYLEESLSGTVRLYDIDSKSAETNAIIGNIISGYEEAKGHWTYKSVSTLEEGLSGADFVIISITPGTFKEMFSDVHTPEKYGIYQPVGDTTGPGGIFRALRTIPMYEEIANSIKRYAKDAWAINYTNPMSICVATLYAVFPEIKAFGCCHEVFGAQRLLLMALKEFEGIEETDRHNLNTNVLGINHFTWINEASYKTYDLMPIYDRLVKKYYKDGICDKITDVHFMSKNLVKFDLYRRYGIIAAAGDRHLAEFVPDYARDKKTIAQWGFNLTPVNWRIENKAMLAKLSREYANKEKKVPITASGEEGVRQIKALLGLKDIITNVNLPNHNQMDCDEGIVVETNALFTKNSVRPLTAGKLPDEVNLIMSVHMNNQKAILKAGLEKKKKLAFAAFLNDPLVKNISISNAKALFNEMFSNTRQYLTGFDSTPIR
ncbi:MAG TPA: alpha-glucosidase/alpha-galactosidase [Tepidanaerobacter syntrophicus]|uniref:family 4 glycosyl hydrolase n=1 Tax=Tepidanaerobacter syntrophicus TaxID=224999 RepID=UPI00177039C5|nr:alpha-glucosidase/alpha-galactosidase [Tepidanaerobacter syntrophicus]HHV82254.1 alpha-glucosidase/alpha-galactosidase [Tepidanaerobacter syntrophicus]